MSEERLTNKKALELIRSYNVHGSGEELQALISVCDLDASALEAAAIALRDLKGGDAAELDDHEVLLFIMKQLVRADKSALALNLYQKDNVFHDAGGGYKILGRKRGRFRQGLELTETLKEAAASLDPQRTRDPRADSESGFPSVEHDRALFLIDLGHLVEAERILRSPLISQADGYYDGIVGESLYQFPAKLDLCDILILTGRLHEAHCSADMLARAYASEDIDDSVGYPLGLRLRGMAERVEYANYYAFTTGFNPYARRAWIRTLQGHVEAALVDFKHAEIFQQEKLGNLYNMYEKFRMFLHYKKTGEAPPGEDINENWLQEDISVLWMYSVFLSQASREDLPEALPPLLGQAAIFYGLLLMRLGKLQTAFNVLDYNRRWAAHSDNCFAPMVAFAEVALSDVLRLQGNIDAALQRLEHPLAWSAETGQKEIACWAHLSLARAYLAKRELDEAETALRLALEIAREHDLVLYEIDGQVTAGRIAFIRQDWKAARQNATEALKAAAHPACGYAWAHGNALHLLAEMTLHPAYEPEYGSPDRKDTLEGAERLARGAVKIRERIRDPRLANSQQLLATITAELGGEHGRT